MELLLQSCYPLILAFLVLLFFIAKKVPESKSRAPPGPQKLPLIGNLHQLIGLIPHRAITKLTEKHGPIMHLQLGEISAVIISSPELAKEVMMTKDLSFANRGELSAAKIGTYNYTDIAFAPYGEYWRQLKKVCILELLSVKRVQSFRSIRENEIFNLVKFISDSQGVPINISENIFSWSNLVTSKVAFGGKCQDQDEFISGLKKGLKIAGGFTVLDIFPSSKFLHWISGARPRLVKIHKESDRIVSKIIDDHLAKRRVKSGNNDLRSEDDLVDVLLNLQETNELGFPLTTDNIKAVLLDMFSAGSETLSTTLEWAFSELVKNPKLMAKAQAEIRGVIKGKRGIDESDIHKMSFLKMVIKETLRLHPPAPLLLPREARETCEINGYEIPFKTKIIINYWAIARDSKNWVDPERFDPDRFNDTSIDFKGTNFEYIPFGAGRRICPGIAYGITHVELPLAHLVYHFDWNLPNGANLEELDMTESFGVTVRRKHDLILVATPNIP